jgi:probable biosynthetic protein (TIGR04098 family)
MGSKGSFMKSRFSLELGMPHLGRNNLSESALFKAIGNDRWKLIQEAGAVPSAAIRDDVGARLYATFFFVELNFSRDVPLSAFRENDVLRFVSDLSHYSKVYLDGRHTLEHNSALSIRTSNVFIYQEGGPSKLSLAVPVNLDYSRIPELAAPPDSLDLCRQAKARGNFLDPEPGDVLLFAGEREFVYQIDCDRDLNGAGLVYFANVISFLDLAERQVLGGMADPMPVCLLDGRSTYHRRIGYFGNARSTDRLHILLKAMMRIVERDPDRPLLDLGFNYRIRRSCDNKEIVVSSCRKVVALCTEGQAWANQWAATNQR